MHAGWLRGSLTDEHGLWDIAYVSLAAVTALVLGTIVVMCAMAIADWLTCHPIVKDATLVLDCRFNADQLGNGVGKVCGAYAAALGALALYMGATRPPKPRAVEG